MVTKPVVGRQSLRRRGAGLCVVATLAVACSRAQPSDLDSARAAASSTAAALLSTTPASDPLEIASVVGAPPTPTPAPSISASDAPPAPTASAVHAKPLGQARGWACASSRDCRAGLTCCQTGFSGHCGGANMPENTQPCVLLQTCAPSPCTPLSMPP